MSSKTETPLEIFLNGHDDEAWRATLAHLSPAIHEVDRTATPIWFYFFPVATQPAAPPQPSPAIHEVDRTATQIWFYFFPLALQRAFEQSEDPEALARELLMQGKWRMKDQVDSSHTFLSGHRFWPKVKRAVARAAEASDAT